MPTIRLSIVALTLAAALSLSSPAFGRTAASPPAPGTPTPVQVLTPQQTIKSLIPASPANPGPYDQINGVISELAVHGIGGFQCNGSANADPAEVDSIYVKLTNGKNALIYADSSRSPAIAAVLAAAHAHGMPVTLRGVASGCEDTIKAFEVYLQK